MRYDQNGTFGGIDPAAAVAAEFADGYMFGTFVFTRSILSGTRTRGANIHVPNDKYILMPTMSAKTESDKVGDNIDEIARQSAGFSPESSCLQRDCELEISEIFLRNKLIFFSLASIIKNRAIVWEQAVFIRIFMRRMHSRK